MAAELADRVSARRMAANGFFLTINTTLVGLLGFMYSELADDKRAVLLVMSMTGILLSSTWFFAIRSYKRLNKAKFQVINKMEKDLPYQNFTDEWDQLKRTTKDDGDVINVRRWWLKFKDIYTDLTNIEAVVPILFGLIYLFIFIGSAFKVIIK